MPLPKIRLDAADLILPFATTGLVYADEANVALEVHLFSNFTGPRERSFAIRAGDRPRRPRHSRGGFLPRRTHELIWKSDPTVLLSLSFFVCPFPCCIYRML